MGSGPNATVVPMSCFIRAVAILLSYWWTWAAYSTRDREQKTTIWWFCHDHERMGKKWSAQSQIASFMWPTWGPPGSCRPQMGPMLAPWTLLSGVWPGLNGCACYVAVTCTCTWDFQPNTISLSLMSHLGSQLPLFTHNEILRSNLRQNKCLFVVISTHPVTKHVYNPIYIHSEWWWMK